MIKVKSTDIIEKDKPDGEILNEDFNKYLYVFGLKIYQREIKYKASIEKKSRNSGY